MNEELILISAEHLATAGTMLLLFGILLAVAVSLLIGLWLTYSMKIDRLKTRYKFLRIRLYAVENELYTIKFKEGLKKRDV